MSLSKELRTDLAELRQRVVNACGTLLMLLHEARPRGNFHCHVSEQLAEASALVTLLTGTGKTMQEMHMTVKTTLRLQPSDLFNDEIDSYKINAIEYSIRRYCRVVVLNVLFGVRTDNNFRLRVAAEVTGTSPEDPPKLLRDLVSYAKYHNFTRVGQSPIAASKGYNATVALEIAQLLLLRFPALSDHLPLKKIDGFSLSLHYTKECNPRDKEKRNTGTGDRTEVPKRQCTAARTTATHCGVQGTPLPHALCYVPPLHVQIPYAVVNGYVILPWPPPCAVALAPAPAGDALNINPTLALPPQQAHPFPPSWPVAAPTAPMYPQYPPPMMALGSGQFGAHQPGLTAYEPQPHLLYPSMPPCAPSCDPSCDPPVAVQAQPTTMEPQQQYAAPSQFMLCPALNTSNPDPRSSEEEPMSSFVTVEVPAEFRRRGLPVAMGY